MTTRRRNGLTLTELLVVGTIILAVTALSIPVVKPMMESQLTKNGANMLATALNRARSRAQVSGRPCGIRFEYWPGTASELQWDSEIDGWGSVYDYNDWIGIDDGNGRYVHYLTPGASLVLRQVEVPPVYTGLLGIETVNCTDGICSFPTDLFLREGLKNDVSGKIQLGGSGPFYSFHKSDEGFKLIDGETYALPPNREYTSFKILLDTRSTMAMPVCMPRGTAVDLQFSGIGDSIFIDDTRITDDEEPPLAPPASLTIMFSPDGSVESINGGIPTEPVHFLVGRWDQISAVRDKEDTESYPNYADGRNYWVSVFPQTGGITVNQVNPTEDAGYSPISRLNEYNTDVPDVRLPNGVIGLSRELTR
ncbi:MAG: hypothetical protein J6S40_10135 [Thermoguttaceae bacterium]|nr:hypothetical protein [Thermoguttaceae bacterium]